MRTSRAVTRVLEFFVVVVFGVGEGGCLVWVMLLPLPSNAPLHKTKTRVDALDQRKHAALRGRRFGRRRLPPAQRLPPVGMR
jgi:hypothetical protein